MPADLPDEQIELMFGYMRIVHEARSASHADQVIAEARTQEAALQRAESEAWNTRR